MPGRNGIETLQEIKRMRPITEVIMLTGHGTVETAIQGMKLGAYDYLMKPTDTAELVEKITKAHQRKKETGRQDTPGGGGTSGENEGLVSCSSCPGWPAFVAAES